MSDRNSLRAGLPYPQNLYRSMRIPQSLWEAKIANIPDQLPYKERCQEIADSMAKILDYGSNLVLHGPFSSGKSALAAIFCKAARDRCLPGDGFSYWVRQDEIPDIRIRNPVLDSDPSVFVFDYLQHVRLLVIDEYSCDHKNIGFREFSVEELFRRRLDARRSTIITTNDGPKFMRENVPGLYAALTENTEWLEIKGYNFRLNKFNR